MNVGGPAVQVAGLMRTLPDTDYEHHLVTGYCDVDEVDFLDTQALDVPATRIAGLGRKVSPTDDARVLRALVSEIRRFNPDIIHTHTAKAGFLGRAAARIAGTRSKVVHTYHGHLLHGYFGRPTTRAVILAERALGRVTDHWIAVGGQVRSDLLAVGVGDPNRFSVVPPGLSMGPAPDKLTARELLGLSPGLPVVAFVGRLTRIKRVDRFVDVVVQMQSLDPQVQFVVAGDGDQMDYLMQRTQDESLPIHILGMRSDIETVLAASDALVLTSDNEGTPVSLIQAGLAGIPVVATDVGSVSDIVHDGETGLLVPPIASRIARSLFDLLHDPTEARRLGSQAKATLGLRHSVERLTKDHETIYQTLLSGAP